MSLLHTPHAALHGSHELPTGRPAHAEEPLGWRVRMCGQGQKASRTEKREQRVVLKVTELKTCCRFLKFWTRDKTSHTAEAEGVQTPPTSPAQQQTDEVLKSYMQVRSSSSPPVLRSREHGFEKTSRESKSTF